jgi:hypothetical protein
MKKLLLIAFAGLFALPLQAQVNDIGMFLGLSKYKGELSNSFFTPYMFRPAVGVYYRSNFNRHWSARLAATIGSVAGDDADSKYDWEVNRNLNFHSAIQEVSATFEFNFLPFELGNYNYSFTPFFFWGLSVFHFNPKTEYRGEEYELQPLATEGQETWAHPDWKKYSLYSAAMPFGGGFKFNGDNIGFTVECGVRRTYTDYLDDVSMTYTDPNIIFLENGAVAAALSDRSLGDYPTVDGGKQRGDMATRPDWFMFIGVSAYISVGGKFRYACKQFHPHRMWR